MFLIIAFAAFVPPPAKEAPLISRTPFVNPTQWNCTEVTHTFGVKSRILRSRTTTDRICSRDGERLIRHGNDKGNIEKRVMRLFDGTQARLEKIERSLGKKKWADAGRFARLYIGNRWDCSAEIVDGTASVWVTCFCVEGTDIGLGYDFATGLVVRVRQRNE